MTLLKTFQEEWDKKFSERFSQINVGMRFENDPKGTRRYDYYLDESIKSYIHSREKALLKLIGEEIEKIRKEDFNVPRGCFIRCRCGEILQTLEMIEDHSGHLGKYNGAYNQALDDIKNILR